MALTPCLDILQFPLHSPAPTPAKSLFLCLSPIVLQKNVEISVVAALFSVIAVKVSWRAKCLLSPTEEDCRSKSEALPDVDRRSDDDDAAKSRTSSRAGPPPLLLA
ncbi:hypothetical protein TorRG33x02_255150 [Trema orientale]|uniref:Uncharacterized protein n=1 Tax=Trema orientale TaxID=63057 RepID=A0A2P5DD56_TREOI|nr:hypothetical protein TorRG33x02_255150 [Trema orientale]